MPSARELVKEFSDLKTLPHVAIKVTQMISAESTTMQDFEEVIKLDPILVMRLLKLVNSPFFGLANKVDSISKAVVFIGMKNLRNLVAVEALRDLFNSKAEEDGFSRQNLWMHSATVAILAQMISQRIFGMEDEDIFLAGIIHDIGLIVEDQLAGDLLREACALTVSDSRPLIETEGQIIETNHCKVGSLLCTEWNLPEDVLGAIKFHHRLDKVSPVPGVTSILQLAEYIAEKMKYGAIPGYVAPLASYLVPHVKERMTDYKILIKSLPEEMAKAKELYEPPEN
jgi:HD-like signal output (HDOD) protein